jgi:hypothetical protein
VIEIQQRRQALLPRHAAACYDLRSGSNAAA